MGFPFTKNSANYRSYKIGDYTYGEPHIINYGDGGTIKIGKFCAFATNIIIVIGGIHYYRKLSQYPLYFVMCHESYRDSYANGDLIIENDVWVATGATILSGFTIGNGAVIAAGAVISKDVQPYAIMAGNPARKIGQRFDDETIEKLQRIKWWDWEPQKIKENVDILCSQDIDRLMQISGLKN